MFLSILNIEDLVRQLYQGSVIVYPTESIFGLGCDPDNKNAVNTLLTIKNRSWKKGLILVAANYTQLLNYIDDCSLTQKQRSYILYDWGTPITWVVPARINSAYWLTGKFNSLAVRISHYEPIRNLCLAFRKPLVSTSANLSGCSPAYTISEVCNQLGYNIFIMNEYMLGGQSKPSEIRNLISGKLLRK